MCPYVSCPRAKHYRDLQKAENVLRKKEEDRILLQAPVRASPRVPCLEKSLDRVEGQVSGTEDCKVKQLIRAYILKIT